MPDFGALLAAARGLLPASVAVADPARLYPLRPGDDLPGALPPRLREFSAGRHAARETLAALGLTGVAAPDRADRAPLRPEEIAGTITHSPRACLAAAGRGFRGLGLDLEEEEGLDRSLWITVLLPDEAGWALRQPDPGRAAKLVFSAKEAVYKAQFALSRQLLGFDALSRGFRRGLHRDLRARRGALCRGPGRDGPPRPYRRPCPDRRQPVRPLRRPRRCRSDFLRQRRKTGYIFPHGGPAAAPQDRRDQCGN